MTSPSSKTESVVVSSSLSHASMVTLHPDLARKCASFRGRWSKVAGFDSSIVMFRVRDSPCSPRPPMEVMVAFVWRSTSLQP